MTAKAIKSLSLSEVDLLTVSQIKQLTQFGRRQVYQLIESGKLGHIRVGTSIRVPRSEYERWLTNSVQRPVAPTIPFRLAPKRH